MTLKLGFIGLGIMGRPMALNLRKAGHALWVHARRAQAMDPLVDAGAQRAATIAEVAAQADIVFTMVSATADVEQVCLGEQGLARHARAGLVVVDMSTISPSATRAIAAALAERGVEMLDAPVSGGEAGAINATLSIMVGGKREIFERVRPLLACLGKNIVHVGDHGAGQVAKACNNLVIAQTLEAVSEAITLAHRCGVDVAKVREAMLGGSAASRVLEVHAQRMLARDFKPGFKAKLHQKDLYIALEEARQHGVALPGTALAAQQLNGLVGNGEGELDSCAMLKAVERLSGWPTE